MGQSRLKLTACAAVVSAGLLGVPAVIAATASGDTASPAAVTASTALNTATPTTGTTGTTGTTATPAGSLTVNAACYVNTARAAATVTVTGSGWSPGDTLQLTDLRGVVTTTVTVSSAGTFTASVRAPVVPTRFVDTSDKIEAIDEGTDGASDPTGGPTAFSAAYLTTDYAVKVAANVSPLRKMLFNLSGFTPNRTVYAHYLTAGGRLLATASFGKPAGACGLRRVNAYEYPGGKARTGAYAIQFDNDPHYSSRTTPEFRYSYVISRL